MNTAIYHRWHHAFNGHTVKLAIIFIAVQCLSSGNVAADDWKGEQVEKDGVTHILNPDTPARPPKSLSVQRLWELAGDDEDYLFGVLMRITSDREGNIYLLDAQLNQVYIFSSGGEYLRTIGREGEGPGEFRRPTDLFLTANGDVAVLQRMPGKVVLLSPEGEPRGNYPVPDAENGGMQMFSSGRSAGDHVVIAIQQIARRDAGIDIKSALIAVDQKGTKLATYMEENSSRDLVNFVIDEKKAGQLQLVWNASTDGRVYTSSDFDAYRIQIWKPDGTVGRVISREYESRVRSEEEKKRFTPRARIRRGGTVQEAKFISSDTDRDIMQVYPRDDGTFWVLSSKGAFSTAEGEIATFDVFDREGRFVEQLTLKGQGDFAEDGFYIMDRRLFVVTGLRSAQRAMMGGDVEGSEEEDAEPMAVICYDLAPVLQAMK